ncbi:MAG: hypothetical protein JXB05_32765 [Myxococcaceae bacterium]|nr:hypothetical protein [Myxococcaceae bacterium]
MPTLIGNSEVFSFSLGEPDESLLQEVDIYVAGRRVTVMDNTVYLPGFTYALERSASYWRKADGHRYADYFSGMSAIEAHDFLRGTQEEGSALHGPEGDVLFNRCSFLDWGPTTDASLCFLVPVNGLLYLTHEFVLNLEEIGREELERMGRVVTAVASQQQLVEVLERAAAALSSGRSA